MKNFEMNGAWTMDEYERDYVGFETESVKSEEETFDAFEKTVGEKVKSSCNENTMVIENGKTVYRGLITSGLARKDYVRDDFIYVAEAIKAGGFKSLDELCEKTAMYGEYSLKNLYERYSKALRNIIYLSVSTKYAGRIKQLVNRTNGYADVLGAVDYVSTMLLFRKSVFDAVVSETLETGADALHVVLSFVGKTVIDYAKDCGAKEKDISQLAADVEDGVFTSADDYVAYPVSMNTPIGDDGESVRTKAEAIPSAETSYEDTELEMAVNSFLALLSSKKGFEKDSTAYKVFERRARAGLSNSFISNNELAKELGVTVQAIFSASKKLEAILPEFKRFIA